MIFEAEEIGITRGAQEIAGGINFVLLSGEAVWITGSNGSGKTSLLRALCGLSSPSSGAIRWNGTNIAELGEEFSRALLYCGHLIGIKDDLTVFENVLFNTQLSGRGASKAQVLRALEQLDLGHKIQIAARFLSMGQRKRVALARLCIHPLPQLLILDEPFSALDQPSVAFVCQLLNRYLAQGGMLVYTTHQEISLEAQKIHRLDLYENELC